MNALIILHPGFEEIEAITPIDLLSRADVHVTQVSIGPDKSVTGRSGITVSTSQLLGDCEDQDYDLVILPGGPGIQQIRHHPQLCRRLQQQAAADRWIACICAAPLLLKDAGLADGLQLCCHPSAEPDFTVTSSEAVVIDGKIITSRGAGTAHEFGLSLISALKGKALADQIAKSICWPH
ncbi:DJ-1 family glyoxalase III [Coraliomargarita akajimensis]|uniref:DJ-1 family protein n=1 Tax=Coraliomargarita akajimensis (strain DSM 45221 / IAM 15411 / JCM 23193 / KCTC 12865 / 04OKA010-24) TaxID=583355 RepID=D5EPG3_CORAD|nr:DJ-1 family glyoxalase III [Coraliomargarita akajimensis]ADE53700.1 DJ-1 family protein [Coraliomargarita akajimensis DSM 45221]